MRSETDPPNISEFYWSFDCQLSKCSYSDFQTSDFAERGLFRVVCCAKDLGTTLNTQRHKTGVVITATLYK